jgi:glycosyltransferase involved in cell wall biosynthesis
MVGKMDRKVKYFFLRNKKNILISIPSLKAGGGAEKVASILGNELTKFFNVCFFTFYNFEPKYETKCEYYTLNEKLNLNIFLKFKKLLQRAYKISKFCNKKDIDIVISFMEESNFPVILSKYFKNKSKIIISIRQSPLVYNDLFYHILIQQLYPKADKIVTVSKEIEYILIKHYKVPKEKIVTIYNPHYIEKYQELSNEPLEEEYKKLFKDSFIFINIGRLTEQKGQWFLIRAFKKVVKKYPNAKLIILGKGELKEELQELIKKLNLFNFNFVNMRFISINSKIIVINKEELIFYYTNSFYFRCKIIRPICS